MQEANTLEYKTILHLAYNLENQKQRITVDSLKQNFIGIAEKSSISDAIKYLLELKYLSKKDNELTLTDIGRTEACQVRKAMIRDEFNKKISRWMRSSTFLDFCEEVYGYRTYFFNMMDKQQIDFVLNHIPVTPEDIIADLGCGSGSVLNLLVKKYGCYGIGIDQLDSNLLVQSGNRITYIDGDIDKISDYNIKPTITLSIDSLYFSNDLNHLIQQLVSAGSRKMYFFYSQYIFDESDIDKSILLSDNTALASVLQSNSLSYHTVNYSENERLLYRNSIKALKKYRQAFEDEGNGDLFEQKLQEDLKGMELYSKGLASRFLYIINKS
jgi:SAM-dependent methyltransferase